MVRISTRKHALVGVGFAAPLGPDQTGAPTKVVPLPGVTGPVTAGGGSWIAVTDMVAPPLSSHAATVGTMLAPSATPAASATLAMTALRARSPIIDPMSPRI